MAALDNDALKTEAEGVRKRMESEELIFCDLSTRDRLVMHELETRGLGKGLRRV